MVEVTGAYKVLVSNFERNNKLFGGLEQKQGKGISVYTVMRVLQGLFWG
jgi:hypothetical protein